MPVPLGRRQKELIVNNICMDPGSNDIFAVGTTTDEKLASKTSHPFLIVRLGKVKGYEPTGIYALSSASSQWDAKFSACAADQIAGNNRVSFLASAPFTIVTHYYLLGDTINWKFN